MKLSDFDFHLPDRMIATRPARPRSASRMLVATPNTMTEAVAADLPDYLQAGDRLVLNDTRVIPARLFGKRWRDGAEGRRAAKMDVTLLGPTTEGNWKALIRPLKKLKIGEVVAFGDGFSAKLLDKDDGVAVLGFNVKGEEFDAALAHL
jgi:S-adenosylmethionine:tRNA ribosyltransferase-isomerase